VADTYSSDVERRSAHRERRRGWILAGVLLSVWAGFFWWVGWGQAVLGQLVVMALGALWLRARRSVARRDWPRLKALGSKTRFRCTCCQCVRLRAEELSASRPTEAVER
jgi:hypothetical protein